MATVHVLAPAAEEIAAAPRAFAAVSLEAAPAIGDVAKEKLESLVKELGSANKASFEGSVPFAAVKDALHRERSHKCEGSGNCLGFAARDASGVLAPYRFDRRPVGPNDVRLQVTHCGICHSDLHQIRGEWGNSTFPMCPGHEVVGVVTEVGASVTEFQVGDHAGIGCMIDSCRTCDRCAKDKEEQYCSKCIFTYNGVYPDGTATQGGYSTHYVVDKDFALHVPKNLPLDAAAPLLCAGITTYSPLRYYGLDKPGQKIGVVGLGGLGHMAVKWGKAFGCEVTVISTSASKKSEAVDRLGADKFVVSKDEEEMAAAAGTLDGIIDTVSAKHDLGTYLNLLNTNGKYVIVGAPPEPFELSSFQVLYKRLTVGGSLIGGIKETQEMLDFAAEHNIVCDIETIPVDAVNEAMVRLEKGDVRYRFVIDIIGSLVA
ncbi:8-hydroxygeraniol dehydrogenase-like [Micractinium conductrix]|uniref:8-hydroxygeraniol dehydrogenase-like n=1 Tax=Micractinium conductrix TaxID=554055 RepID=A0A2P6VLS2_9CHLO|nr:8-hydroxygeraniol dehydrogenase-like [Micractinium conductrix]|eukprot:PSC75052.1 8-hydroxygeraniol dehydrogenase-like [Micractinium conductrix]